MPCPRTAHGRLAQLGDDGLWTTQGKECVLLSQNYQYFNVEKIRHNPSFSICNSEHLKMCDILRAPLETSSRRGLDCAPRW